MVDHEHLPNEAGDFRSKTLFDHAEREIDPGASARRCPERAVDDENAFRRIVKVGGFLALHRFNQRSIHRNIPLEAVLKVPGDDGQSSMISELGGGDHANSVLPFKSHRRPMGAGGAAHPSSEVRRPSTYNGRARCIRRNHLSAPHWLPMAAASQ
jgi:hypothetical protein